MTGIGSVRSAMQPATAARRGPAAPYAPATGESGSRSQPGHTQPPVPAWLAAANRIRAQLAGYDNRPDPERNQTDRHDQDALDQLAELSKATSPWEAAKQTFGTSNPQPRGDT